MTKLLETIGESKLVQLEKIGGGKIFVKVEKSNPAGSIKDRAALYMIKGAIEDGS
ncbi:MAG: cysteine synthase A, partial [Peptoniphilus harei]|nr:cysteine synthase A [Peptoniphilus harei]